MKTNRWIIKETDADLDLMSKVLGISPITANVMANRGLRTKKTALSFLHPSMENMHNPHAMKGLPEAITLISKAITDSTKIVIYGDYDVDGVMSTVIMLKTLKAAGADVDYYIPHRIEEGYGLNIPAVEHLHKAGCGLLITVDNGISSIDEIAAAKQLGMTVIVVDHHEPGFTETETGREDILPNADVIIDPKQAACSYPFKELCAGGLTYKLAMAFIKHTYDKSSKPPAKAESIPPKTESPASESTQTSIPQIDENELLALASIATICDIVSLKDENRILAKEGLASLNANKLLNPGLGSLIASRGYLDKPIDTFTIGFVIGPCLNATGRLGHASQSVDLLMASTTDDPASRINQAATLCELNDTRKNLTADCVDRAMSALTQPLDKVLVLIDTQTHESIAGIVAGRIKEATGHPTIFLTQGDGAMKGSGRSIEGYNLFEALYAHRHLFIRFGGHPQAAGLTLPVENIPILKEALNKDCNLTDEDFTPAIYIDREIAPTEIKLKLSEELTKLAPFGKDNKEPLFISRNLFVESCRIINDKNTLIFTFSTQVGKLKGIAFGLNQDYASAVMAAKVRPLGGFSMDVVYTIETNVYNGVSSVQVRVKDFFIA